MKAGEEKIKGWSPTLQL